MAHRKLIILSILAAMFVWFEASLWAVPLESLMPKKDLPDGWALIDGPQTYTEKTLFNHIDGQAELYLKYGFQKSIFAIYQNRKNPKNQIELDIYDMGNVLQAFGIFSRFRNEDRPGGFGLDSYLNDRSALFYKGKYFVLLYASESSPSALEQWAKRIASGIVDTSPSPKEISYFPKDGLEPGSIQYFPEGLLGHQFLKRGFEGAYTEKGEDKAEAKDRECKLFLAIFENSQEAMTALRIYKEDLSKKGRPSSGSIIESKTRALKGEDPYQGKVVVVQKGFYLLGVVGYENEEDAENRLAEFVRDIK